jgi:hypothetical protein
MPYNVGPRHVEFLWRLRHNPDGDAVGLAGKIGEDGLRSGEGWFPRTSLRVARLERPNGQKYLLMSFLLGAENLSVPIKIAGNLSEDFLRRPHDRNGA